MAFSLVGMIMCAKKQKTHANAQPIAIGLLALVAICGFSLLWQTGTIGDGGASALVANEMQFLKAKGFAAGDYLGKTFPGNKVLIIVGPKSEGNMSTTATIEGIKEGEGANATGYTVAELIPLKMREAMEAMKALSVKDENMPPQDMNFMSVEDSMKADDFNLLINANSDCKTVISMVGLPQDADGLSLIEEDEKTRPKLFLLSTGMMDIGKIGKPIAHGFITGVVIYKPNVKFSEAAAPSDMLKAFDERYMMITTQNIEKVAADNPNMFKK